MTPQEEDFLLLRINCPYRWLPLVDGQAKKFFEDVSTGAQNDIELHVLPVLVTEFGMSDLGPIQYERDTGSVFLGGRD